VYENLGYHWATSFLAFLTLVMLSTSVDFDILDFLLRYDLPIYSPLRFKPRPSHLKHESLISQLHVALTRQLGISCSVH
jgi:hypothetical protein